MDHEFTVTAADGSVGERHRPTERIAFIQACWHRDIVDACRDGLIETLDRCGHPRDGLELFEVPGAFELPLQAQVLATSGRYAAIVAAGLVVDGGIYRHEFVAGTVLDALMRIQLEAGVPVLSAVLTPQRFHEHDAHRDFFRAHLRLKGGEVAEACLATIAALKRAALLRPAAPRHLPRTGAPPSSSGAVA